MRRTLVQRYRYSSLGLLWAFAPALVTSLAMSLGQKAKFALFSNGLVPAQFYAIFGIMMAQTFFEALNTQRSLFTANSQQLSRSRIPIEGLVLAGIGDNVFSLTIKIIVLLVCFLIFGVHLALLWPLAIVGFGLDLILGSAIGLLLAPINALKNDVENVMIFLPWILFAVTPVFVPPRKTGILNSVYRYNPLTKLFGNTRDVAYAQAITHHLNFHLVFFLAAAIITGTLFTGAWLLCRVARPYVVERYLV